MMACSAATLRGVMGASLLIGPHGSTRMLVLSLHWGVMGIWRVRAYDVISKRTSYMY